VRGGAAKKKVKKEGVERGTSATEGPILMKFKKEEWKGYSHESSFAKVRN